MITVHELITKCWADVVNKKAKVCIQTIRLDQNGNPRAYIKEVEQIVYDHRHKRLIIK